MFRLWARIVQDNRVIKDTVVDDGSADTRTHKVFHGLDEICLRFGLSHPIWLESNIADFQRFRKTRFRQDSFMENIPFEYLEIQVLEED